MNVVDLATYRARGRLRPTAWEAAEAAELIRLYHAKRDAGDAVGFAYGETDLYDPQFYVLGGSDARPCTACVSRLDQNGHLWYVIEDGQGDVQFEGACLRTLVARLRRHLSTVRHTFVTFIALFDQQWGTDMPISTSFVAIVDSLPGIV
jgi:hypothetical protein